MKAILRLMDKYFICIVIVLLGFVVYSIGFCTREFFKYGDLKYKQGWVESKEFHLQLKAYNYE